MIITPILSYCNIVARHPDCPPKGRFGKNVYVQTTLLKFEERLPLDKMGMVLDRQGLDLSEAKIIGTLRNGKDAFIYETLGTLPATWTQRGLNPSEALSNALTSNWTNTTS